MFLVTGGTGFIGGHLLGKLCARGIPVRCLGRGLAGGVAGGRARGLAGGMAGGLAGGLARGLAGGLPGGLAGGPARGPARSQVRRSSRTDGIPEGVEMAQADWATGQGIEAALDGVDTVIHLAGVTKALAPADYYTGNARATETLARLLAGRPIRFVHVSSLAAMGPSPDGAPLTEDARPCPLSHYGKSKLEGERMAARWRPDAVIVRPPVVYGPRDTGVLQILKSIASGVVLEISGGERWFSAIYAEDLAEGLIAAAEAPQAAGRTYFLAHPKVISWSELAAVAARIIFRQPGRRPRVVRIPPAVARAAGYCAELWSRVTRKPGILSRDKVAEACCRAWTCDSRRAARELGFEAATSLETGLARTLAWYKEAGWIRY
jgi:nucleoside-diphosphate-sugar epimerase